MLEQIVDRQNKHAAGIKDYQAVAGQNLGNLLDHFKQYLQTSGNRSGEYIETTVSRIEKVFAGCGFLRLADVDCESIAAWLAESRAGDAIQRPKFIRGKAQSFQEIAERFNVSVKTVSYWRTKGAPIVPRKVNDLASIVKWHAEFTRPRSIGSTTSDHYVTALKRFGTGWSNRDVGQNQIHSMI